ncbi:MULTISPECIES: NAD(P)H:quinone oxidoreductase [Oceanobacillus]|uniref:NAD(P)H dehydrogenase (Quinone) n=1 Tax=Oceanobacillus kimchii TaxID=746691 RepID=A0ABQ5TNX1_9BACI|nr:MULTISPECIES: NAD(P)H:quinone oxidoreductase [Oceanobacillus]MBT2599567.1 NAD(P)H:quinone oxidoreductase [Oceanobacillus sp. ISL-74]GLO67792.1 NAD(P)H dehydrogenase (quinone) [Oceanobacillus kimchii]
MVKLAIIYYSATGTNYQMAKWAEEAGKEAGAEVKVLKVQELAPHQAIESNPAWKKNVEETKDIPVASSDELEWADAILFSTATRFGGYASQMKQFLDIQGGLWAKGALINKTVSAMSSAQNDHGGQEASILSFYTSLMHWGAIIVPPGYTDPVLFTTGGNPYGASATVDQDGNFTKDVQPAVSVQTKRLIEITKKIISE